MQGYGYVYHKERVDMLQAQPVSPRRRFGVIYVGGLLVWFVPTVICMLLALLVALSMGAFSPLLGISFCWSIFKGLLAFLAIYHMTILAVMMTGHLVVGTLATAVFAGFEPLLRLLLYAYFESYFFTYYDRMGMSGVVEKTFTSPFITLCMVLTGEGKIFFDLDFVKLVIQILLYLGLAYYAFRKRPMEAAGHAMAFARSKLPIYVCLVFMGSLMGGVFFQAMVYEENVFFCGFGMVLGAVLTHILVQIIYEFDVRSVIRNKLPLACTTLAALVLLAVFVLDLFGYDRYVPRVDQVRTASIRLDFNNMYRSQYLDEYGTLSWGYSAADREKALEEMTITDPTVIVAFAERHMKERKVKEQDYYNARSAVICYRLKCGRIVYRELYVDLDQDRDLLNALFADPEFKNGISQVDDEVMTAYAKEAVPYFHNGWKEIPVRDTDSVAMLEAYRQDYLDMTYDDAKGQVPCGFLEMTRKKENGRRETLEFTVLPTFTRTIAYLQQHQAYELMSIDPESLGSVTVSCWKQVEEYFEEDGRMMLNSYGDTVAKEFTDPQDLKRLAPYLVSMELADRGFVTDLADYDVDVTVEGADNDAGYAADYNAHTICFKLDETPEFVKKALDLE